MFAFGVALRRHFLVEDDLGDAGTVAKVEEDEVTVVAAPVDPAHQHHLPAGVGGAQFAAHAGSFEVA